MSKLNGDMPVNVVLDTTGFIKREKEIESGRMYGLTKREHFASLAMQGLLANSYGDSWSDEQRVSIRAKQAVEFADELLRQLEPKE